jgi:hypothetical protein
VVKSLRSVVSANRVVASGWEEGECGGQCSWTEMLCDRGKYDWCDSEKQESSHMSKVGRKERK